MTVAAQTTFNTYTGNGVTTVYPYQFKILDQGDLDVYVAGAIKALGVDYTVSGVGADVGGVVTFIAGAPAASAAVSIIRSMTAQRLTDYQQQGDFNSATVNPDFDRAILLVQDLQTQLGRSLRLPPDEVGTLPTLPSKTARAGKYDSWDASGQPIVSSGTGNDTALRTDLAITTAGSDGARLVGFRRTEAGSAARTVASKLQDGVSVKDFGAVLDGVTNDTAALIAATQATAGTGMAVIIPYGTLLVTPATAQAGAANYNCACALLSNTSYVGYNGATIKVSDNYSTDGTPKELAIFSTSAAVSNVSFSGITFDLNGANNKMSPARPASYNRFNHAAIIANGNGGILNDVRIEGCTFKNTAGVCYIVCQLVAAGSTPAMGVRWTVKNNLFLNGGSDTDDLTCFFGWAEEVTFEGNIIWQDSPPQTVGLTGGMTGFEVHGARSRYVNNVVRNFRTGGIVSSNFTNKAVDIVVAQNQFYTSDYGVLFYRQQIGGQTEIDNVIISNNIFYFDTMTTHILWSDAIATRVCIGFEGGYSSANQLACNNIKIQGNLAIDNTFGSTNLLTIFVRWDTCQNVAAQVCSNLSITDNEVIGFTEGVYLLCVASGASNPQGFTEISNNKFISLSPDSGALYDVVGIKVNATTTVKTLVIDGNQFIDERGAPSFLRGILFTGGTVTDLCYGQQFFKGLTGTIYQEVGTTITNRRGQWVSRGVTGAVPTATAIGHGLPGAPTQVMLQQLDATPSAVFPSALGATTFTINFAGGGNHAFNWQASIGNQFP